LLGLGCDQQVHIPRFDPVFAGHGGKEEEDDSTYGDGRRKTSLETESKKGRRRHVGKNNVNRVLYWRFFELEKFFFVPCLFFWGLAFVSWVMVFLSVLAFGFRAGGFGVWSLIFVMGFMTKRNDLTRVYEDTIMSTFSFFFLVSSGHDYREKAWMATYHYHHYDY